VSVLPLDRVRAQLSPGGAAEEMQRTLDAAEGYVAARIGRPLGATTATYRVVPVGRRLTVPATNLTGLGVTDPDGVPVVLEEWRVNLRSGVIELPYTSGGRHRRRPFTVTVTFDPAIDPDLELATLIIAAHLWQTQRTAGQGENRPPGFGGNAPAAPVGFAIPNRAATLLERFTQPVIA
jgi:hypothetical protein